MLIQENLSLHTDGPQYQMMSGIILPMYHIRLSFLMIRFDYEMKTTY